MSEDKKGARVWSVRGPMTAGVLGLLVMVGGLGAWSVMTELRGAVIASGRIEVDQNRQVVQHPDGGIVAEILVKEGDPVEAGQLLIRLDAESLSSELAVVEGQLLEVLARRGRFEAERDDADTILFPPLLAESQNPVAPELIDGQQRLFEARRETERQQVEQMRRRAEQIVNQVVGLEAQQAANQRQLDLIGQELTDQRSLLERGLAQAPRVMALEREQANLQGNQGELAASVAEAGERATEIEIEILRIAAARREEAITRLRDLQFNEIELSENRRQLLTRLDRLDIRAPLGGVVYGLQVFAPRSVVRAADPLLFIVPQDRPLIITAQISPIHIDQIFVGQHAMLAFSAFDQRQTPQLEGHVVQISADAFTDQASQMSFYRAELAVDDGQMERLPANMTLIPGMPVEAFFGTQERTPLEYLLKPLTDYFAKAFREN